MLKRLSLAALIACATLVLSALPTWTWVDTYGSPEADSAEDMLTDSGGNVYFCGSFKGTIVLDDVTSLTATGTTNMFLCKLDPLGNVLWAFQNTNTGANVCVATCLALDASENLYMGGYYTGNMSLAGSTLSNYPSFSNAFFCKVEPSGNVSWIQGGGGTGIDQALAVTVDPLGQPVFCGIMKADANFGSTTLINQGAADIFMARLDSNGQWLNAKRFGGNSDDQVEDIAITAEGEIWLTGAFNTATAFDSCSLSGFGIETLFVSKLDSAWNALWCRGAGGNGQDRGKALALGTGQTAYLTGTHGSNAVFGNISLPVGGTTGIFTAALDASGNWLWVSSLGASTGFYNEGSALLRRPDGDLIISGQFSGALSAPGNLVSNGNFTDLFVARYNQAGQLQWAERAGGTGNDTACSLALKGGSDYYVFGSLFTSSSFGDLTATCGYVDLYLAILSAPGPAIPISPGPLAIQIWGANCSISWPAVSQSTDGQALTDVYYKVYRASRPDFADEILALQTASTIYTEALSGTNRFFYRVSACVP